jgi:Rieske Fe-S protein
VLALTFAKYPQLQQSGGSVTVKQSGYSDPVCGGDSIIVIETGAGQYSALSASCTHSCCPVSVRSGTELYCPCHGATFDFTGKVTKGPAKQNLASLAVCADSTGVYVTY